MQQWEYGCRYITAIAIREGQGWSAPGGRKLQELKGCGPRLSTPVAVVEDASGRRILGGANTAIDALNALGYAGWQVSDGPGPGNGILKWLRDIVMAAETQPATKVITLRETTHFMRRPVPN